MYKKYVLIIFYRELILSHFSIFLFHNKFIRSLTSYDILPILQICFQKISMKLLDYRTVYSIYFSDTVNLLELKYSRDITIMHPNLVNNFVL